MTGVDSVVSRLYVVYACELFNCETFSGFRIPDVQSCAYAVTAEVILQASSSAGPCELVEETMDENNP